MIMQAWTMGETEGGGRSIKFAKGGHSTMFIKYITKDGNTIGLQFQDQTGTHERYKGEKNDADRPENALQHDLG